MIVKEFTIDNLSMKYHVGINQIKFNFLDIIDSNKLINEEDGLNFLFNLIDTIQSKFKDSVVQFFKTKYMLNPEHVFVACYFVQKAFYHNINISNTKNIELFLYLSAKRQIKNGIDAFGISTEDLKSSILTYCIISPDNNLNQINKEIIQRLNASEIETNLELIDNEKCNAIKGFFELSNNQINTVLKSYGKAGDQETKVLNNQVLAIQDLICEKMSILSLEKTKT